MTGLPAGDAGRLGRRTRFVDPTGLGQQAGALDRQLRPPASGSRLCSTSVAAASSDASASSSRPLHQERERHPPMYAGHRDRSARDRDQIVGRVLDDRQADLGAVGAAQQHAEPGPGRLPAHLVTGGREQVERRVPGDLGDAEVVVVRRDQAVQIGSTGPLHVGQLGAGEPVVERLLHRDRLGVAVEEQVFLGEVEQLVDGGRVGRDRWPERRVDAGTAMVRLGRLGPAARQRQRIDDRFGRQDVRDLGALLVGAVALVEPRGERRSPARSSPLRARRPAPRPRPGRRARSVARSAHRARARGDGRAPGRPPAANVHRGVRRRRRVEPAEMPLARSPGPRASLPVTAQNAQVRPRCSPGRPGSIAAAGTPGGARRGPRRAGRCAGTAPAARSGCSAAARCR